MVWYLFHKGETLPPETTVLNAFCLFALQVNTQISSHFPAPVYSKKSARYSWCLSFLASISPRCPQSGWLQSAASCQGHWWPGLGKATVHISPDLSALLTTFSLKSRHGFPPCPWPLLRLLCWLLLGCQEVRFGRSQDSVLSLHLTFSLEDIPKPMALNTISSF